ncbi:alpha/beta fold hydrolase [Amycolatopsis sp. NPDC049868]|uniref:alpha/beta fold hydrolase n=1 Tax=Amycolatopsis sp. NPDC049868 TaxID=3363934 RepID=UPI0037B9D2E8
MLVRILGPVDVVADGVVRPVRGLRRKALLAVLALRVGEIVSVDRLTDVVWGARPPTANTVQTHVSALRGMLGDRDAIVARSPGYVLNAATDLAGAQQLIEQAGQTTDPASAAAHLREAVALWRDEPLADVTGMTWLHEQAERLALLRLDAVEALGEARLALGEHARLVPELEKLCRLHPFREHLHRQLMLALYGVGRQADALDVYERLRRALDDQLGVEPGPALRESHAALLRQDTSLERPPAPLTAEPNRFCTTGSGARVAYNATGRGSPLVVPPGWIAALELGWQDPGLRALYAPLLAGHRVIRYDLPGTGLSGPVTRPRSLDGEVEALHAVIDAAGAERVALLGVSMGAPVALAFAARYPDRVDRLVLYGGYADGGAIAPASARRAFVGLVRENWGLGTELLADVLMPDGDAAARARFVRMQRATASAEEAARLLTTCYEFRVTGLLDQITVPTLVLHRREDRAIPYASGKELATRIRDARFVALEGRSHLPYVGDAHAVVNAIVDFLAVTPPDA